MSDIHGDNHDREGQNDLNDAMHKEQSMRERLSPTEIKQLLEDIERLEKIVEKGKKFFRDYPKHIDTQQVKTDRVHRFVTELARKWKVGEPDTTIVDVVRAAELVIEKMKGRIQDDKIDEQINRAMEHAEQLTVDNHGNFELNTISEGFREWSEDINMNVLIPWNDPNIAQFVRVRYIGDVGMGVNLSYAYGVMKDGTRVRIQCPSFIPAWNHGRIRAELVKEANKDGVYLKSKGFFDALSILV